MNVNNNLFCNNNYMDAKLSYRPINSSFNGDGFSSKISFEGAINRNSSEWYKSLTGKEKKELRQQCFDVFTTSNGKNSVFPNYVLMDKKCLNDLVELSQKFAHYYKNDRIVGLGRSPLWMLEISKNVKNGIDDFIYVPYSRSRKLKYEVFTKDRTKEDYLNQYRGFLKEQGLDPETIVKKAKNGQKTVVVDYISSGKSMSKFLDIFYNWPGINSQTRDELKDSLKLHALRDCYEEKYSKKVLAGDAFINREYKINTKQNLSGLLSNLTTCSDFQHDSPGFSYPIEKWFEFKPSEGVSGKNSNLVEFWVMDNLAKKHLLKNKLSKLFSAFK